MKKLLHYFANFIYLLARNNTYSTCMGPCYQFEEPEVFKDLG